MHSLVLETNAVRLSASRTTVCTSPAHGSSCPNIDNGQTKAKRTRNLPFFQNFCIFFSSFRKRCPAGGAFSEMVKVQISYGTITTVDADVESGEIHKSMPCSISGGVYRNTIAILLLLTCSALAFIILDAGLKMAQKIRILFEDCNAFTRPLRRYHAISFEVCFWAMYRWL